jgi:transcriptional regulator with XRE-family HTH domain
MEFPDWLNQELNKRGWTYSELARRAGISHSTVSTVISRASKPGPEFCLGIARALGLPPEDVFRKAELLPPLRDDKLTREIISLFPLLKKEDMEALVRFARAMAAERAAKDYDQES